MIQASCHCSAVRISITEVPTSVTSCNCSICRRLGTLWAYYRPNQVQVEGATAVYIWGDKMLEFHRCQTCGCVTHWAAVDKKSADKMGVNARLLDGYETIPVRLFDGASM